MENLSSWLLIFVFIITSGVADVSIKIEKDGSVVNSGDSVLLPTTIKLTCEFTPSTAASYAVIVKSGSGPNAISQVYTKHFACMEPLSTLLSFLPRITAFR